MIAISNEIQERSLKFSTTSLLGTNPPWTITEGTGTAHGSTVELDANSKAAVYKNNINKKITYLKITCELDADDHTLSTQFSKNVAIIVKVTYIGNTSNNTFVFYPNYIFEEDPETFTAVELSGDKVSSIDVQIINSENTHVDAYGVNLFYIVEIDESNIGEAIQESYAEDPQYIDDVIDEYMNTHSTQLTIPLVNSLPSISSVPDGYICRLS